MGFPQNGGNLPAGKFHIPSSTENSLLETLKGGTSCAKKEFFFVFSPQAVREVLARSLPANLMKSRPISASLCRIRAGR